MSTRAILPILLLPALQSCQVSMESNQPPSVHRVPNRGVQSADLAHEWSTMVRDAASKSGVVISSSQTGEFGGVQTMNAELSGLVDKGDHAKFLYDACDSAFTQRARIEGAQMSFTSMGNFSCTRRFKFETAITWVLITPIHLMELPPVDFPPYLLTLQNFSTEPQPVIRRCALPNKSVEATAIGHQIELQSSPPPPHL